MRIILKSSRPLCSGADLMWRCSAPLTHRRASMAVRLCTCMVLFIHGLCGFSGCNGWRPAVLGAASSCCHAGAGVLVSPLTPGTSEWLERLYGVKYALQDFMFS